MSEIDLDQLRAELDEFAVPERKGGRSAREERIIAGFEDVQSFVSEHGHAPQHGEDKDIFERLYAVRLDRMRALPECLELLVPLDHQGLLGVPGSGQTIGETPSVYELGAELEGAAGSADITKLRHVRSEAEKRAAEEIANRMPCPDFGDFKPLFERVRADLKSGFRSLRAFHTRAMEEIRQGTFFVIGGQFAYVADVGEEFTTEYGRRDSRLRVIYDNATESGVLLRSLQRALHRDTEARLVTQVDSGPLFNDTLEDDDIESGTIYVLRSLSNHPYVAQHREVLHKIGVTGGQVDDRIAHAASEMTYLLADVDVVATYKLAGVNRKKLEAIFHRVFAPALLDLTIHNQAGQPVRPREWFLVPLPVIDEAVQAIRDGSITRMVYDPRSARLIEKDA